MAGMCLGGNISGETETVAPVEPQFHPYRFMAADKAVAPSLERKRRKLEVDASVLPPRPCRSGVQVTDVGKVNILRKRKLVEEYVPAETPKFGVTSVCGRRRDMEDSFAIHPFFFQGKKECLRNSHFFGVYDGHGCSHVAAKCKDRMHEIVREELERCESPWDETMKKSFSRMDKEITVSSSSPGASTSACRCELRTPQCDAVGSTAVVAVVTPDKIVVSNCGDSRAVLCRNGTAIPLSVDHKADRVDEVKRVEEAGGRIIYWDGPRVQGFLAMSRAIGDNYLKPYVISEPEVTVTNRTPEDDCLILATDGLWDVVSNETACGVARMCLQARKKSSAFEQPKSAGEEDAVTAGWGSSDKGCSDASILLTKLALARRSSDNISVVVVDLRRNV